MPDQSALSVALIGNYPPSFGGVQVHIQRLRERLGHHGIECKVYCPQHIDPAPDDGVRTVHRPWWGKRYFNYWGYHWLTEYGLTCSENIIHCHEPWKMSPSMLGMLLRRGKKILTTIHDQMFEMRWKQLLPMDRLAVRWLVKSSRAWWIAVSQTVKDQLLALGVPDERICVIPAYLAPVVAEEDSEDIPLAVRQFVAEHSPIISTYGWMLILDDRGVDLHSFDHCVDLVRDLKEKYPRIGLLMCIASVSNHGYLYELKRRIAACKLERNIFILSEPMPKGYLLWKESDLYLRATTTDGDAVSIREALSLKVPVVASDASCRPPGTVLFRVREYQSMIAQVSNVLQDKERYLRMLEAIEPADTFPKILSLYKQIGVS